MPHHPQSPWQKMSLQIHFLIPHAVMHCQFQRGRMLLLSSLTSPLKGLTLAMTLTCSSASSTYHYLSLQRTTLLTLNEHIPNKTQALSLLQKLLNILINYQYFSKVVNGNIILCHTFPNEDHLTQWKLALTKEIIVHLIKGHHRILPILAAKVQGQYKPGIIIHTLDNML